MSAPIPPAQPELLEVTEFPAFTHEAEDHDFHLGGTLIGGKRFYDAGARSAEPVNELVVNAIAQRLETLENRGLLLTQDGLVKKNAETLDDYNKRRVDGTLLDVRAIQLALTNIPRMIVASLTANLRHDNVVRVHNSYALKHHLEKFRAIKRSGSFRGYITNGDFTMAMLLLGFKFTCNRQSIKNANFRCASLMECVRFNPGTRKEYTARMRHEFDDTQQ